MILLALVGLATGALFFLRSSGKLAATSLPRLTAEGNPNGVAPANQCAGSKGCLVVYIAPWCGPCKESLPGDRALADLVKKRGIETTFVVGMDTMPNCISMTRKLGRDVLVDTSGAWAKRMGINAVPQFLVTGPDGSVTKRQAGALSSNPEEFARRLGI
jgi:thiol-disulfide isomerase/thioredoxin